MFTFRQSPNSSQNPAPLLKYLLKFNLYDISCQRGIEKGRLFTFVDPGRLFLLAKPQEELQATVQCLCLNEVWAPEVIFNH